MGWAVVLLMMVHAFETSQPLIVKSGGITPVYDGLSSHMAGGVTYANPYGFEGLHETVSYITYGNREHAIDIQWHYFGIAEYREDTLSAGYQWAIVNWLRIGFLLSDYILTINTQEFSRTQHFLDYGLYGIIQPIKQLTCVVVQNNIKSFNGSDYITPYSIVSLRGDIFAGCRIEYSLRYDDHITQWVWINGYITNYCAAVIGYSRELAVSAAGVSIVWNKVIFQYMLEHHSFLGNTHRFGIVYSSSGHTFPFLNTNKTNKIRKMDIQACSVEDLMALDIIPEVLCGRIIKYRDMFGAVSIKSLSQLGLTAQQIRDIQQYTYNYYEAEKDEYDEQKRWKNNYRIYISKEKQKQKVKHLFQSMIAAGVASHEAIVLAEEYQKEGCKGVQRSSVYKRLNSHQQNAVDKACGIQ